VEKFRDPFGSEQFFNVNISFVSMLPQIAQHNPVSLAIVTHIIIIGAIVGASSPSGNIRWAELSIGS